MRVGEIAWEEVGWRGEQRLDSWGTPAFKSKNKKRILRDWTASAGIDRNQEKGEKGAQVEGRAGKIGTGLALNQRLSIISLGVEDKEQGW